MVEEPDLVSELAAARATIAAQAVRIHQLEEDTQRGNGVDELRQMLELSDIVGITVGEGNYRRMFEATVQAVRQLFNAGAASLLLLDHASNELVFEAANGGADVVGLRVPATTGLVGWVVMTGEPIAVADVKRDPRWNKTFAERVGYMPNSILAVPVLVGDEVEGVIEVLDKGDGTAFGMADMDLLSLFARPVSLAVEQARMVSGIGRVLVAELARLAGQNGHTQAARAAHLTLQDSQSSADQTLQLARLVHDIGRKGERARGLAVEILGSIARYMG